MSILQDANKIKYLLDTIAKEKIELMGHEIRQKRNQNLGYRSATLVMYVKKRTLTDGMDGIRQRNVPVSMRLIALEIVDMKSDA